MRGELVEAERAVAHRVDAVRDALEQSTGRPRRSSPRSSAARSASGQRFTSVDGAAPATSTRIAARRANSRVGSMRFTQLELPLRRPCGRWSAGRTCAAQRRTTSSTGMRMRKTRPGLSRSSSCEIALPQRVGREPRLSDDQPLDVRTLRPASARTPHSPRSASARAPVLRSAPDRSGRARRRSRAIVTRARRRPGRR